MANKAEKKRRQIKKNDRNMFQMRTRRLGQGYGTRDEVVKGGWRGKNLPAGRCTLEKNCAQLRMI
jgi:hypothetical protein